MRTTVSRTSRPLRRALTALTAGAVALAGLSLASPTVAVAAPLASSNPVTPGNFTGYGFDQCLAPTQKSMDAWLEHSPFLAVGIYVSGDSRACRDQPNLTRTWVSTQLQKGWKLLPISLGPQASCHPSFPRYEGDEVINPRPGKDKRYENARVQARAQARTDVRATAALGIPKGSTIWYDLEHFDIMNTHCRESSLAFISAWVYRVRALGYVAGMYGGASSSIKMLDDARVLRPGKFHLPSQIWIARWDGVANTSTSYIREDGWRPGGRMKQYIGDHLETHGGVTINIDSNYLDLGRGSFATTNTRCGTKQRTNIGSYPLLTLAHVKKGAVSRDAVRAAQCLLREQGYRSVKVTGVYGPKMRRAIRSFRATQGLSDVPNVTRTTWIRLLSAGDTPVLKVGSHGRPVHRLQQALRAADHFEGRSTGLYDAATRKAVRTYQRAVRSEASPRVTVNGISGTSTWQALQQGRG